MYTGLPYYSGREAPSLKMGSVCFSYYFLEGQLPVLCWLVGTPLTVGRVNYSKCTPNGLSTLESASLVLNTLFFPQNHRFVKCKSLLWPTHNYSSSSEIAVRASHLRRSLQWVKVTCSSCCLVAFVDQFCGQVLSWGCVVVGDSITVGEKWN